MTTTRCLWFLTLVAISQPIFAVTLPGPLVDNRWLAGHSKDVVVLDIRNDTKSFTAQPVYKRDKKSGKMKFTRVGGHIPGAILVSYKKVRVKRKIDGRTVTRMAPLKSDFEQLLQKSGVSQNSTIVIVSKGESAGDIYNATRFYWQLKYYGHKKMAILNGGTAQWIKQGYMVHSTPRPVKPGNWRATAENKRILATSEDVARAVKSGKVQLVDTRSLDQYLGLYHKSYVYGSGHIAGAKYFPPTILTASKMPARFHSIKDLRSLAKAMRVDTKQNTITYCNSGHLATGTWFILSEVMKNPNVRLYDGSMHQWTLEKRPTVRMRMD